MERLRGALTGGGFSAMNPLEAWAMTEVAGIAAICGRDPGRLRSGGGAS